MTNKTDIPKYVVYAANDSTRVNRAGKEEEVNEAEDEEAEAVQPDTYTGEGQRPARFNKRADTRLIGLIKKMQRAERPS